jgi:histone arginine demethylase JMJD6
LDLSWSHVDDGVDRIHVSDVPPNDFIERFEAPYKPVVILGAQDNWKALEKWTVEVTLFKCHLVGLGRAFTK